MNGATSGSRGFDAEALRERYRVEREKRLRPDGVDQYVEITGRHARFAEDHYARPVTREPRTEHATVAVVGGGFAGLIAAVRLRESGVDDICVIEKASGFGGTWYWNRYPGAQCDVESYVYLPLLEETGYIPTEKYAAGPEILQHCHRIAEQFGLYERALLSTEVTGLSWDADRGVWAISTNHGDRLTARYVAVGGGPLHRPKLPGIPGLDRFEGHAFHTSRWDYAYTGGGPAGGLTGLAGRRVGVIGTGATAVQVVPRVAEWAEELYVFQRTPSSVDVRGNRPTDPAWAASLTPGWQRERIANFTQLTSGGTAEQDLVMDGWTDIARLIAKLLDSAAGASDPLEAMETADFEKMERIRARVDEIVTDPSTAAALKPWFRQFCKRPCFHDEYLQAFNRPNVHLVDTDGRGVQEITADAAVVGERKYPLDCLIFATGFEVGTEFTRRSGFDVVGVGGQRLSAAWANGVRTMFGMHVHGFPNLFLLGHQQGGFTANYPHLLDEAARHLSHILARAVRDDLEIEVTAEAEADWVRTVEESLGSLRAFQEQCTPGYFNAEGEPGSGRGLLVSAYGFGPMAFFALLASWRAQGGLAGLELRPTRSA